jgi:hypothetical protein
MARRTTNTTRTTPRETRVTSRVGTEANGQAAAPSGMGLTESVAIVTTIVMLAAILMCDYYLGHQFATGVFFKP